MSATSKYALWLRPFGDIAFSLKQRIRKLSEAHGSPLFEPHVTLLGGLTNSEVELVQMTNTIAISLKPFDVVLTRAGCRDTYFQSLFVYVEPSKELMNARKTAERLFGYESDEKFEPHLSLMYGNYPREQKERILNSMGREFHIRFPVDHLLLIQTGGDPSAWKKSHTAEFSKIP